MYCNGFSHYYTSVVFLREGGGANILYFPGCQIILYDCVLTCANFTPNYRSYTKLSSCFIDIIFTSIFIQDIIVVILTINGLYPTTIVKLTIKLFQVFM